MEHKPESLAREQEFVVAGLPLVDTVIARRLLKAFGTVEKVFVASEQGASERGGHRQEDF